MGLDMYVERFRRLNDDELKEIQTMGYHDIQGKFNMREWDAEDDRLLRFVKPYVTFVERPVDQIDFKLAKEVFGIPLEAEYAGGMGGSILYFRQEGREEFYEVDIWGCSDEQRKRMIVTNNVRLGVYHRANIFCWRTNYRLQKQLHNVCDVEIENIGFYPLNDAMKKCIMRQVDKSYSPELLENTEDSIVCYHEWY